MPYTSKKTGDFFFLILSLSLIIFKWQDLSLGYFWDELGVYSKAAYYQYHHGTGLLPASVPPDFSRGHPLMFTFLMSCSMRLLGGSVFFAHAFCLGISILLLYAVYSKTTKYFDPATGAIAAFILAIQPIFLAQSCMVLPEIALGLFMFLALCSYYDEKFLLFAFWGSVAILTKEPGIVLPAVALFYSGLRWVVSRTRPASMSFANIAITCLPYMVFGLFLGVQRYQNGWFFFPYHMTLFTFHIPEVKHQFDYYLSFLIQLQGRYVLKATLIAGLIVAILLGRLTSRRAVKSFLLLLFIFALAMMCFNGFFTVYLDRYIMAAFIPLSILSAASLTYVFPHSPGRALILLIFLFVFSHYFDDGTFHYDADLGYRRDVRVMQQAIDYIQKKEVQGDDIGGNFPPCYAIHNPESGYWDSTVHAIRRTGTDTMHYQVIWDPPGNAWIQNDPHYYLLHDFKDCAADVAIYVRRKPVG